MECRLPWKTSSFFKHATAARGAVFPKARWTLAFVHFNFSLETEGYQYRARPRCTQRTKYLSLPNILLPKWFQVHGKNGFVYMCRFVSRRSNRCRRRSLLFRFYFPTLTRYFRAWGRSVWFQIFGKNVVPEESVLRNVELDLMKILQNWSI